MKMRSRVKELTPEEMRTVNAGWTSLKKAGKAIRITQRHAAGKHSRNHR